MMNRIAKIRSTQIVAPLLHLYLVVVLVFPRLAAGLNTTRQSANAVDNSSSPKVRVNILCLTQLTDMPMFTRETFANDTNLPNTIDMSSIDEMDVQFPGSVAWLGNSRLNNIAVRIFLHDTKFRPEFNLRKTFATVSDQLSASFATNSSAGKTLRTIHLIVGPVYSDEAKVLSLFTPLYNLALISGSAGSAALADRSRYPYFFRTCPSDGDGPDVIGNVLKYFGYTQVNILYFDEGFVLDLKELLEPNLRARGIVIENSFLLRQHDNASFFNAAQVLSQQVQSHIWLTVLSANDRVNYELLCALSLYGHISGTTYLGFVYGQATSEEALWWKPPLQLAQTTAKGDGLNSSVRTQTYLYDSLCTVDQLSVVLDGAIHLSKSATDLFDRKADVVDLRASEFKRRLQIAFEKNGYGAENFYTYLYYKFDALTAAALALDQVERNLQRNSSSLAQFRYNDSRTLQLVVKQLAQLQFQGLTGEVKFSENGNREYARWSIKQFQNTSTFVTVGSYEVINSTAFNINFTAALFFSTVDGKQPPQFVHVALLSAKYITLLLVAGFVLLLGASLGCYFIVRKRSSSEVMVRTALQNKQHWLLDVDELHDDHGYGDSVGSRLTHQQQHSSVISLRSQTSTMRSSLVGRYNGIFASSTTTTGITNSRTPYLSYLYKEARVCLFPLRKPKSGSSAVEYDKTFSISFDREFVSSLLQTQYCSQMNDNLTRFVGIVPIEMLTETELPTTSHYIVMAGPANGSKGSLSDFIVRSRTHGDALDEACAFSILKDLHTGLTEVHRQLGYHGRLSSAVCLIDNRLTLRLSDYGFRQYRQESFFHVDVEYDNWLWTAPEVLAKLLLAYDQHRPRSVSVAFSKQQLTSSARPEQISWPLCDVYSFGTIAVEVFTCWHPFSERLDSSSVLDLLRLIAEDPNQITKIKNEVFAENNMQDDVRTFINRCMSVNASTRLTLAEVGASLNSMMRTRKLSDNLTEMLMQRLEMYASNLEAVVEQRTLALVEEENKVRHLLYQILPPMVADALKNGQSVPPQTYASVTIYFSDIVGFTTISAQSTPLQVIDLLNDLYNSFDKILSTFDVYKVETIGDAYMVVSGLPKPNDMQHVLHIARMSVTLIDHVTGNFRMRHKPDEQLKLRIGMHTGGCAAGVVGFVMPRYCLFGDTVNTASRMESTGEALRIHTSCESAKALRELGVVVGDEDTDGEFELIERGLVDVKGKGNMKTFWLRKKLEMC